MPGLTRRASFGLAARVSQSVTVLDGAVVACLCSGGRVVTGPAAAICGKGDGGGVVAGGCEGVTTVGGDDVAIERDGGEAACVLARSRSVCSWRCVTACEAFSRWSSLL